MVNAVFGLDDYQDIGDVQQNFNHHQSDLDSCLSILAYFGIATSQLPILRERMNNNA